MWQDLFVFCKSLFVNFCFIFRNSLSSEFILRYLLTSPLLMGWCKTWTLDWTHGLDCGLRFGLDFGLMRRAMTTISKRLWIEGTVLQLQARLVTSSLVRTFPGPSGYEVKSQGASLEATCKHVEVAKSVSPAGMASPHRNGLQYHRDAYEG